MCNRYANRVSYRGYVDELSDLVLDEEVVITGSFNFTKSADTRNAENVVFIDSRVVAAQFIRNWEERRSASRRFEPE